MATFAPISNNGTGTYATGEQLPTFSSVGPPTVPPPTAEAFVPINPLPAAGVVGSVGYAT